MRLPKRVVVKCEDIEEDLLEELSEFLSDYLTDKYGYCHNGFCWDIKITCNDIDWDKGEE